MRNLRIIFGRELAAYFNSAIAVIFAVVFAVFANGLFMLQFFQVGKADMRLFFGSLPFTLTIFVPAISMRLWSEDKRGSTFELLLTFPMRPYELVLGKYLASLVFYAATLATTLTIPVMLSLIGRSDLGPIAGGYLGALLMGGMFLAAGIFISGLSKDQIVAFILTMLATFALFFFGTDFVASFFDGSVPGLGTFLKNTLGAAGHLVSFNRGIIDVRDVLYFVVLSAAFLFLNGLSLEGRYRPRAKIVYASAVAVAFVCMTLVNLLFADLSLGRFDVTQGRIYTISDVSLKILRDLKVPVQAKLYVSPSDHMPTAFKTLEQDIVDKLEELKNYSKGQFGYKVVHLDPQEIDDTIRHSLEEEGVMPFQVESIQKDEVGVKIIYSAITLEYKEKPKELLPRVLPATLNDFEYQVLSRIYKMSLEERPKVTVFAPKKKSGEDQTQETDVYQTAALLIRQNGYDTARIEFTENDPIPPKTKTLLLLNPGALTDRQRYELNKYVYEGGSLVVAAQPYEYAFTRGEKGVEAVPAKLGLGINLLIEKWGVKVNEDVLCDRNSQVISLSTGQRVGPYSLQMPVKLPNQIVVDESQFNRTQPLTSRLPSLFYLWGAALDVSEDTLKSQGFQSDVLFTSSRESWKVPSNGQPLTPENLEPTQNTPAGPFPLSILMSGKFANIFGKSAPAWKEGEAATEASWGEQKPGKLLVIGCSSVFNEDLIQNPGNINLFANIVDGLTLGDDLIKVRSKQPVSRDIRRLSSAEKTAYRFFTVLLVPILIAAAALIRSLLRKKEKEFYLQAVSSRSPNHH